MMNTELSDKKSFITPELDYRFCATWPKIVRWLLVIPTIIISAVIFNFSFGLIFNVLLVNFSHLAVLILSIQSFALWLFISKITIFMIPVSNKKRTGGMILIVIYFVIMAGLFLFLTQAVDGRFVILNFMFTAITGLLGCFCSLYYKLF